MSEYKLIYAARVALLTASENLPGYISSHRWQNTQSGIIVGNNVNICDALISHWCVAHFTCLDWTSITTTSAPFLYACSNTWQICVIWKIPKCVIFLLILIWDIGSTTWSSVRSESSFIRPKWLGWTGKIGSMKNIAQKASGSHLLLARSLQAKMVTLLIIKHQAKHISVLEYICEWQTRSI